MEDPHRLRERIVVVGSGVTGLACSVGLAQLGYAVALCGDEPPLFNADEAYDLRVFALNDASCDLLRHLGVWDAIAAHRLCPYEAMEVWAGRCGRVTFRATDIARPRLGVIVENRLLCSVLFERLRNLSRVEILCPSRFKSMQPMRAGGIRLVLEDDSTLEADLVVAADGADSQVRLQAGMGYERNAYHQSAIVATVECETAHRGYCFQRFSSEGITAFLPLAALDGKPDSHLHSHQGSIVWSCDQLLAAELAALPDEAFGVRLRQALESVCGAMTPLSERVVFPLHGALARDYVSEGVALVGDAAHSVHPLAGQGANRGLGDVQALLRVAEDGVGWSALRRYQRSVKGRNLSMKYALDAICWGFTGGGAALRMLSACGLTLVDRCLPLKTWFMERAADSGTSSPFPPKQM